MPPDTDFATAPFAQGRLAALRRMRFAVLGRAGMDFYADPPGSRIEGGRHFVAHLGGSAGNIAAALARQGAEAALISRVSDDAVGRFVLTELDHYGIDRRHVSLTMTEERTSLAVVETRAQDCQSVIYRNGAADFALSPPDIAAVDFTGFGALVVTGTALAAEPSRAATLAALASARAAGAVTVMDLDYRPYSWPSLEEARRVMALAAKGTDIVIGNDVEFGHLAGSGAGGQDAAQALIATGTTLAIYKMGENGAVTFTAGGTFTTGIYRTKALKPTGAGDAFMGGLLAALGTGAGLRSAVLRGSASAAIVVSRPGCAPACPTAAELDSFLAARPEPT